jgi:transposase
MSKAYSCNLTQWQWELIEPLIPPVKPGGRNREVEMWSVLNAIFYILTQGCTWRNLPGDFPAWQTVYTYFRNWRKDGTWVAIHERLRDWIRSEQGRKPDPSEAIIDSQSVKTAARARRVSRRFSETRQRQCLISQLVMMLGRKLKDVNALSPLIHSD